MRYIIIGKIVAPHKDKERREIVVDKKLEYDKLPFDRYPIIRGGGPDMRKIRYSKDVDALLIELSDKKIDYAEEEGQMIIHFSKDGEPVLLEILDAKDFVLNSLSSVMKEKEVAIP
jgi:uncharacterized protein YuzE